MKDIIENQIKDQVIYQLDQKGDRNIPEEYYQDVSDDVHKHIS